MPVVDEGGVLVEMRVAAVCRTDLKMIMEWVQAQSRDP